MRDTCRSDRRSKGKENPWNMRQEMCTSILGRSLLFCCINCILSVALFHHCDAVVEDKKTEASRDHRVTLIMEGIVPGIVNDNERQTTLARILSPSSVAGATASTTTTTTAIFSRASRAPQTATLIERPVQPSTGRRTAAARSDCCFVGQAYARTNMSCAFMSTDSANEPAGKTLKGSEIKGRVQGSWPDVVEGRAPLVGRRIDRMLLKCLTYDELEVHMKRCCRNEKKLEATRKCRRLINARQRRICRLDAAIRNS